MNWVPVSCIPSPESPANRITTESRDLRSALIEEAAFVAIDRIQNYLYVRKKIKLGGRYNLVKQGSVCGRFVKNAIDNFIIT